MENLFRTEMVDFPSAGGLTGDPSVFSNVERFLSNEWHFRKVNQLLQEDACILEYRSIIDCLLSELVPEFKDQCFEFYRGEGLPFENRHQVGTIEAIDTELQLALEVLVSQNWSSWSDFKTGYKAEIKWEPL